MDTPTLPEVIASALDAWQSRIRTAIPARVLVYSTTTQTAQVRPEVWPGGAEPPAIDAVPVIWPRGGNGYLVMPVAAGDTGLLICCDSDLGEWRRTGEAGAPADLARHSLQGAVFVPGLVPRGNEVTQVAGATILAGLDVRLGAAAATEAAVLGDAYTTAIEAWVAAAAVAIVAAGGPDLSIPGGANSILSAALHAALSTHVVVGP